MNHISPSQKVPPAHGLDFKQAKNAYQRAAQQKLWGRTLNWKDVVLDEQRNHLVRKMKNVVPELDTYMYLSSKTTKDQLERLQESYRGEPLVASTLPTRHLTEMVFPPEGVALVDYGLAAAYRANLQRDTRYVHGGIGTEQDSEEEDSEEEVSEEKREVVKGPEEEELEDSDAYASSDDDEEKEEENVAVRCVVTLHKLPDKLTEMLFVVGDCKESLERGCCSHALHAAGYSCPPELNVTRVCTSGRGSGGGTGNPLERSVECSRCKKKYVAKNRAYHEGKKCAVFNPPSSRKRKRKNKRTTDSTTDDLSEFLKRDYFRREGIDLENLLYADDADLDQIITACKFKMGEKLNFKNALKRKRDSVE